MGPFQQKSEGKQDYGRESRVRGQELDGQRVLNSRITCRVAFLRVKSTYSLYTKGLGIRSFNFCSSLFSYRRSLKKSYWERFALMAL